MSYIHKRTFEIIQDSNIDNELDDYFEVDELIALPIQKLNLKGYKTKFCCSGHSFPSSGEAFAAPEMKDYEHFIGGTYKTEEMPDGRHRILFMIRPVHETYIVFADGSALPPVPNEDWYYDGNTLTREYPDELDEYEFLKLLIKEIENLYRWAISLPISC